jgi:ribosomal protein L27
MPAPNQITFNDLPDGGQVLPTDILVAQRGTLFYKVTNQTAPYSLHAGVALTDGQAVYIGNDGNLYPAQANALGTSRVIGFVRGNTAIGVAVTFYYGYADITGITLTIGAPYYLSWATAGIITNASAPSGNYSAPVGIAVATDQIQINIQPPQLIS